MIKLGEKIKKYGSRNLPMNTFAILQRLIVMAKKIMIFPRRYTHFWKKAMM